MNNHYSQKNAAVNIIARLRSSEHIASVMYERLIRGVDITRSQLFAYVSGCMEPHEFEAAIAFLLDGGLIKDKGGKLMFEDGEVT
jgi:hypothetical protein